MMKAKRTTIVQKYTGNWKSTPRKRSNGKGFHYWAEVESKKGNKYWIEVNMPLQCDPYMLNSLHKEGDWAVIDISNDKWEIVDFHLKGYPNPF